MSLQTDIEQYKAGFVEKGCSGTYDAGNQRSC